jgi:hypothetical protein
MITLSIKKMIITTSMLCAIHAHAIPSDLAAVSVFAAPFVVGAVRTAYLCNFDGERTHSMRCSNTCPRKEYVSPTDECTSTYLGGFFLGVVPIINLAYGIFGYDERLHNRPRDIGYKAGVATDISFIAALALYARLIK